MQKTETLIVGQGLCGTWLSWWMRRNNHHFIVIDEGKTISSSRIASGVINPVTGRVLAPTWMVDTLIPFALEAYTSIGNELGISVIQQTRILHSFPTQQMREAFEKKLPKLPDYLHEVNDFNYWDQYMQSPYGLGGIAPALLIDLNLLLNSWQKVLKQSNRLLEESFNANDLELTDTYIRYKDITAERIIFCDGIHGMSLPWFNRLPFSPNKGEALLLEIKGLPADHIYKKGISLVPYPHVGEKQNASYFWAGSTYENRFEHDQPTEAFRQRTEDQVRNWLKLPFKTLHHWAAIRPATVERRPFVGMHPHIPRIGLLNGMGTKGCSLAPYFGKQLTEHIINGSNITPEASLSRFSSLLRP